MSKNARDDIRIPIDPQRRPNVGGRGDARRFALNQWRVWNNLWNLQFRPTIEVLRFTEVGGDLAIGVSPTKVQVQGLDAVEAVYSDLEIREVVINGEPTRIKDQRRFDIWRVPESINVNGEVVARILLTDVIRFMDDTYDVTAVEHAYALGRNLVTAKLRVSAAES